MIDKENIISSAIALFLVCSLYVLSWKQGHDNGYKQGQIDTLLTCNIDQTNN